MLENPSCEQLLILIEKNIKLDVLYFALKEENK